jgi:predicted Zn-dependent protease
MDVLLDAHLIHEALQQTHDFLQHRPESALAHYYLGVIRIEQGQTEGAMQSLQRATELDPQSTLARVFYAAALLQQERRREAAFHCRAARAQDNGWPPTFNQRARHFILKDNPGAQDVHRAIIEAEVACLASEEQEPGFLYTLAVAYALAGRFGAAKATAEKALARATATRQTSLAKQIRQRLHGYTRQQPFGYAYRTT